MQKPSFSSFAWGRRRLVLLCVFQLIVVCIVFLVVQRIPADLDGWIPRNPPYPGQRSFDRGRFVSEVKTTPSEGKRDSVGRVEKSVDIFRHIPYFNEISQNLEMKNHEPPRNRDLFPTLAADHTTIVLYVHNRPQYLRVVVHGLSQVKGIEETLLIVSHDGFFPEMNSIINEIRFCQVKQIFATFSPHLFPNSFPGQAPEDCKDKENAAETGCIGNPDQYGNHRSPRIVSLKHHWWWMMNTVWDGLAETRSRDGHVLFIEEDHYLLPNAYRTIQMLSKMVGTKCPECVAVNLAPVDVSSRGSRVETMVVEKIGNVGYAFNRTVWTWIHAMAKPFCMFDDYNWDIGMWAVVYPSFPTEGFTLRGPSTSAIHFGKCGLHQGQDKAKGMCVDDMEGLPSPSVEDTIPYLDPTWKITKSSIRGYNRGFEGWGGWGDKRDQKLCMDLSTIYSRAIFI